MKFLVINGKYAVSALFRSCPSAEGHILKEKKEKE